MFWCGSTTGLEIRNGLAYGQENKGDQWRDARFADPVPVPMSEARAEAIVCEWLYEADAPACAEAMSALTGQQYAVSQT